MIRPVLVADIGGVAALQVRTWHHAYGHFVTAEQMPTIEDRRALATELLPGQSWLAERGGQIVGVVGVREGTIKVLYVDPPAMNTGIGSTLLAHAEDQLRLIGHTSIVTWTFRDNQVGRGFVERRGWVPDGEETESWPGVFELRYLRHLAPGGG